MRIRDIIYIGIGLIACLNLVIAYCAVSMCNPEERDLLMKEIQDGSAEEKEEQDVRI